MIENTMQRFLFLLLSMSAGTLIGQPAGLTPDKIQEYNIRKVRAVLDMESDDSRFENLEVYTFEFDREGRCIREENIFPFQDVVATSDEYFMTYDQQGNLVEKIKVHKNLSLTASDQAYQTFLGNSNDTTISRFVLNQHGDVVKEIEFEVGLGDTLVVEYEYTDGTKTRSKHFSTQHIGVIWSDNFTITYDYDELGRLSLETKTPETLRQSSITTYKYIGSSKQPSEKVALYDFRWTRFFNREENQVQVLGEQDSSDQKVEIFEYDENGNLLESSYMSSSRWGKGQTYGTRYEYIDGLLSKKEWFRNDGQAWMSKEYVYDSRGLLLEERIFFYQELEYTHKYQYE